MRKPILTFGFLLTLLTACGEEIVAPGQEWGAFAPSPSTWRMGVFSSLDNDLDEGPTVANSLFRFAPRYGRVATANLYDGRKKNDSILYFQAEAGGPFAEEPLGEIDSGSAKEVARFIQFVNKSVPGERSLISLADHGGGAIRGLLSDDPHHSAIYLDDMEKLFQANPVDVALFDACHMNMVEVAHVLVGGANTMVGAPTTTVGDMPYAAILQTLQEAGTKNTANVARLIGETLLDKMRYEVAIGAIDLTAMPAVGAAFRQLSAVLEQHVPSHHRLMREAIVRTQPYAMETDAHYLLYNDYRDAVDMTDQLAQIRVPAIRGAALEAKRALSQAILMHGHHNGRKLKLDRSHGLAIYAPLNGIEANYLKSRWAKETGWGRFLAKLIGAQPANGGPGRGIFQDPFPRAFPTKR